MEQVLAALAGLGREQLALLSRLNLRRSLRITMAPGEWETWTALGSSAQLADSVAGLGDLTRQTPSPEALAGFIAATNAVFEAHDEAPLDSGFWPFSACRIANMCAVALEVEASHSEDDEDESQAYASDQVDEFFEFAEQVDNEAAESAPGDEAEPTTFTDRELAFWLNTVEQLAANGEASTTSLATAGDQLADQYLATLQA